MEYPYLGKPAMVFALAYLAFLSVFCSLSIGLDNDVRNDNDINEYHIGIGDVIQISVWQYDQFNTTSTVAPDGKIAIPLIGDVIADGKTRSELKKEIVSKLDKFVKEGAEVTINITQFNSQKISIFGSVTNSKVFTFSSPPSLLELIINAAPTADADLTAVKIIPANTSIRQPVVVNLSSVLSTGDTSKLPELHSGDVIYVPKSRK